MNELTEVEQNVETVNRTIDNVGSITSAVASTISTVATATASTVAVVGTTISTVSDCKARMVETKAKRDVAIKKLHNEEKALRNDLKKINIIGDAIDRNFEERAQAIDKTETVIDKGLENNDLNTVIAGLGAMVSVVTKSPLKDLNISGSPIIENELESDDDSIIEI